MADSPRKRTVRSAAGYMRPTMSSLAKKRLKFSVNAGRDPLPKSSKIPPKQSDRAEVQSKEVRLPDAGPISLDDQDVQIELRREESMGMGGPNSESYILDSRGAPVERKAVISRERLILGHCLVLSILVERATMLTVEDDEFWEGVAPVEFGDLPALQDAVTLVGYPIGGDTISVTSGVVSRIEILSYFHGSTELLGLQIDAAINSGNSGVLLSTTREIVWELLSNHSSMRMSRILVVIPTPVIMHFIKDSEKNGTYNGFPILVVKWQKMENPDLRLTMGMKPDQKGLRIRRNDPTAPEFNFLKPSDIILSFNGNDIANDGTVVAVPFRHGEHVGFSYLVSQKYTGDNAAIKVLHNSEILKFDIKLESHKRLIPAHNKGKPPSYYIIAGFVFTTLSVPYLCSEAIPIKYLGFFLEDDAELEHIRTEYRSGHMLTGEVKKRFTKVLTELVERHRRARAAVIDEETFAEYTARTSFERPLLSGVAYAQRILNSQREEFERQHGWTIRTMEEEPSPIRDEYAPVIFSQETVSYIESLDMMSGEEDRENILRARATGKAVLTSPFRLLNSHHLGVVLTFPVYNSTLPPNPTVQERIESTAGYLGGAFDVESLVENLLGQLSGNGDITVNVYDTTNSSDRLIMYGHQSYECHMSHKHVSKLDFGDPFRKHEMICGYLQKAPTTCSAQTTSFFIFVICHGAAIHIKKVEHDFHEMEELKVRAEAADIAKSQFLATVSHEIRTPMNGILGMLQLLLDTELSSTQKDFAQTAKACGDTLITLINEVLDRAKIEAGKLELEAVPFDLRSILDDVLSLFSEKSRRKGVELAVFVSDKVPEIVDGNPGRFRQVVANLVGNSVKFTDEGHIFVQVHLAAQAKSVVDVKTESCLNGESESCVRQFNTLSGKQAADDRSSWETFKHFEDEVRCDTTATKMMNDASQSVTLMVYVEDTGIGIPEHAQKRVFTPFMQADGSTSRNYGGTCIGLSISKCLVELMGGQMGFISLPQIGSTFSFTVEFQGCENRSVINPKKSLSDDLPPTGYKGLKALIVDGKQVRAAVTRYHLKLLGIQAEAVSSIKTVVALFGKYDTLISKSLFWDAPVVYKIRWKWECG